MVRVSGFGQTGPYAPRAGYGAVGEAMGGLRYVIGEPDRRPPGPASRIGDTLAAHFAAIGALIGAARARAHRPGPGGRLGDLRGGAGGDGVAGRRVRPGRLRARAHRLDPAQHRALQRLPDARRRADAHRRNGDTVFAPAGRRHGPARARRRRRASPPTPRAARTRPSWTTSSPTGPRSSTPRTCWPRWPTHGVPAGRIFRAPEMLEDPQFAAREAIVTGRRTPSSARSPCRTSSRSCRRRRARCAGPGRALGAAHRRGAHRHRRVGVRRRSTRCEPAASSRGGHGG